MFEATIAGSLPKPSWLAETHKLWPQWKAQGAELAEAKRDATLVWIKAQEDAGLDIVTDGEQSRQHFVHGFLEAVDGIDFEHKVEMGIRGDRYKAMVPQVVGPLKLKGRVHGTEARFARAHTKKKLKITMPGPMTIVDTVADRHYGGGARRTRRDGDGVRRPAEPGGARARGRRRRHRAVRRAGVQRLHEGRQRMGPAAPSNGRPPGLTCTTAVHICYGYGIKANIDWKKSLGEEWRQYEEIFPAIAKSSIAQVSLECAHSHVPMDLIRLLEGKDVMVGVIDVASDVVETPEEVADTIGRALQFVARERLLALHQLRHGADGPRHRRAQARGARAGRGARARSGTAERGAALSRPAGLRAGLGGDVVAVRDVQQLARSGAARAVRAR